MLIVTINLMRICQLILQTLLSLNASISLPGTPSLFRLLCLKAMGVKVSHPVWIGANTELMGSTLLSLGRRVAIGENSHIICHGPIEIGDDFIGAPGLYINSGSHDIHSLAPIAAPIKIGKRVWCGTRVTICAGVEIGDDVVIGAGAVVTKSLPSGFLAYGIPAKPIKPLDRKETDQLWSVWRRKSLFTRLNIKVQEAFRKLNK
jgi:acetyltransferase-like isoleucine patch superfamily enzyme